MHSNDGNKIGLIEAIAYCVGDIIGSGIFVSPTSVLQHSGSVGLSLIMWTLGAFIAVFGALVYIELGTTIRKSGCDFAYLTHVGWHPIASAFLFVATTLTYPAILAIHTMAFGEYFVKGINVAFGKNLSTSGNIPRIVGFTALLPLAFLNLFSLKKFAGRFQIVATIVKFLVILIIIGTGFWYLVVKGETKNFHNIFNGTNTNPDDIVLGLYNGLFAYDGFDVLNFGTEEIENPRRTMPLAVFAGIGISAIVYISMNLAYFSVLSIEEFKGSDTVAVDFAEKTLGSFYYAIPFLIAILLLGSMNSTVFTSSRYLFAGSKAGIMPAAFKCVHPISMSPRAAVIVEVCVTIGISFIGNLEQVLNYMTYAVWMQRTVVQMALIYMRFKHFPVPKDAFINPIFIPFIFLFICISLLVIPVKDEYQVGIYGICLLIAGFIIYSIFIFPNKLPKFLTDINENGVIATQILLNTMPFYEEQNEEVEVIEEIITDNISYISNNNNNKRKYFGTFGTRWE
uniref:Amino acid transporter n=1 Tax=Panagrolaimus sp. PS1159 TaxID=55785 RepID=A0AC35FYM9_9BILA